MKTQNLTLFLALRICPLFFVASALISLLAYSQIEQTFTWRNRESVRCAAITAASLLESVGPEALVRLQSASKLREFSKISFEISGPNSSGSSPSAEASKIVVGPLIEESVEPWEFLQVTGPWSVKAMTSREPAVQDLAIWRKNLLWFCFASTSLGFVLAVLLNALIRRTCLTLTEEAQEQIRERHSSKDSLAKAPWIVEFFALHEAIYSLGAYLNEKDDRAARAHLEGPSRFCYPIKVKEWNVAVAASDFSLEEAFIKELENASPGHLNEVAEKYRSVSALLKQGEQVWRIKEGKVQSLSSGLSAAVVCEDDHVEEMATELLVKALPEKGELAKEKASLDKIKTVIQAIRGQIKGPVAFLLPDFLQADLEGLGKQVNT